MRAGDYRGELSVIIFKIYCIPLSGTSLSTSFLVQIPVFISACVY